MLTQARTHPPRASVQHVPSSKISDHHAAARSVLRNADPGVGRLIDEHPDFDPPACLAELPKMDEFGGAAVPDRGPATVGELGSSNRDPAAGNIRNALANSARVPRHRPR